MLRWWWKCHRNFWRYQTSFSLFWTQVPRFAQCSIWISRCTCIWLLWSQGPVQELLKFPYHIRLETTPCLQQYCVSRSWTDPKFPISTQDLYSSCFRWLSVSSCGTLVTWATFSQKSEYCTIVGLLRLRLWGWFFSGITLPTQWAECPGRKAVGHWTIIRAVVTPYPKFIPSHPTKELKIWTLSPWWRQSVFSEYSTNLFVSTQATGKGKLKGFHLNGDQVPFQNILQNLFVSTQATKERKIERLLP